LSVLGGNRYGKSGIRLVRVDRGVGSHTLTDLTVDVTVEGEFSDAYVAGDNSGVLPTDTMRGTVYALAGQGPVGEPEAFGKRLATHFLDTMPGATLARVDLVADPWTRIETAGGPHPFAFTGGAGGRRVASVTRGGTDTWVVAGVTGLVVLKTTGSAFEGFMRDRYTTLQETDDRILATEVSARWRYGPTVADWSKSFDTTRRALLESFATHDDSRSLQHTLYAMGEAVLAASPEVDEVRMVMPNRHHVLVDLSSYGLSNDGTVFVATDRPFGVIQGEVARPGAPAPGRAWG
jgi:urate oxidase